MSSLTDNTQLVEKLISGYAHFHALIIFLRVSSVFLMVLSVRRTL